MSASDLILRLTGTLDPGRADPLAHQIVEHVWLEVIEGTLETGVRLPTVRSLSIELGVSPRTVERAYRELERLGVTSTHAGQGTFVSLAPPSDEVRQRRTKLVAICREALARAEGLGYGLDDLLDELAEFRTLQRDEDPGERTAP